MESRMIFAGFGGQGVLLAGQLIAEAGMHRGQNVTWMPSYGPEMRGGAANCSVVLSDDTIGTPVITDPDLIVAMNIPSLELLEKTVVPGGTIIYNSSLISNPPTRTDVKVVALPCNDIANSLNAPKTVNMPILGAVMAATGMVTIEELKQAMIEKFGDSEAKKKMIDINIEAIKLGEAAVKEAGN